MNEWIRQVIFFIFIVLLQGLLLKQIQIDWDYLRYMHILFYPIFLINMPFRINRALFLLIAAALGLSIDLFYDSPGVHAAACVFTAFIRRYVLTALEPREGYQVNASPTKYWYDINWYLAYSSLLLFLHLFFYFSVEAFTFVYFFSIWMNTIFSFVASMLFILMYNYLFNPR